MNQGRPFVWKRHGPASWVGQGLRNHHGEANSVSQVNGDSEGLPVWKKAAPSPILALMPDNSVPSHMFVVPFELLSQHWSSEIVTLCKSVHRPFMRDCLGLQNSSASIPAGF